MLAAVRDSESVAEVAVSTKTIIAAPCAVYEKLHYAQGWPSLFRAHSHEYTASIPISVFVDKFVKGAFYADGSILRSRLSTPAPPIPTQRKQRFAAGGLLETCFDLAKLR